jgi:uncharacterized protein YciI
MQETTHQPQPEKKFFLLKLIAPRPTFASDMTDAERRVMQDHGAYLKGYVDKGTVIVMGPVLDPNGSWGLAVVEAGSEDEVKSIIAKDPTVLSAGGFRWEIFPDAPGRRAEITITASGFLWTAGFLIPAGK